MSDTTPVDSTRGLLTDFFEGNEVGSLARRPLEARWRAFVEPAVHASGVETSEPVEYLEWDWDAERCTRGYHGAHFASGIWTSNGPVLAAPDGCLYRVRVEYLAKFNGCMEGAVRSDEEAAVTIAITLV